jgi:hypothetical protein
VSPSHRSEGRSRQTLLRLQAAPRPPPPLPGAAPLAATPAAGRGEGGKRMGAVATGWLGWPTHKSVTRKQAADATAPAPEQGQPTSGCCTSSAASSCCIISTSCCSAATPSSCRLSSTSGCSPLLAPPSAGSAPIALSPLLLSLPAVAAPAAAGASTCASAAPSTAAALRGWLPARSASEGPKLRSS